MKKILIVDDEKEITDLVEIYLKNDGFEVLKFYNGTDALECAMNEKIDLAILDVMLPDVDGFTICKKIREKYFYPIIMLTAKIEDVDKITGLTLGADDYVTKPFNPLELLTRVKSQLRRYTMYNAVGEETDESADEHHIRGLDIWKSSHKCSINGTDIELTPLEFNIVWYLCEQKGNVVSSEELFEKVWKEKYLDNNNTVMAHIARIREKMDETPRKPRYIKTVWGVGYTIDG
ncbi:MAG: VanR-ABDEGLN family response regulator transcription factor [Lachnospiraceae bacterium]|nr:VanR-ABDEGLN family response regulator transcription factor [Lachnospiraceae bacterium]